MIGRIATKSPRKASVLYSLLSRIGDPRTSRSSHDARPVDTLRAAGLFVWGPRVIDARERVACGETLVSLAAIAGHVREKKLRSNKTAPVRYPSGTVATQ